MLLQGAAAGACVVTRASCKYTHSGGGQDRQKGVGSIEVALQLQRSWLSVCTIMVTYSCHRCMTVKAIFRRQARGMQVYRWKGYL